MDNLVSFNRFQNIPINYSKVSKKYVYSVETDGITHPTDTALRDFSGKCINEFVKWTIKQTSETHLAKDPINIKILVQKMRFYSTHPDSFKKMGAALIFNNMYRELREELALLSIFWIEFLHIFIKSLSSFEFETDDSCVSEISLALKHLERGFVEKSHLFNAEDRDRRVPIDIKGGCLEDVVVWLLQESTSRNRYCRQKCLELFCALAPKTKHYKDVKSFIEKHFQPDYEMHLVKNPSHPNKWMQGFLCALDGGKFLLDHHLVDKVGNVTSDSIEYFIVNLASKTLDAALSPTHPLYTTFEKQVFDKQRAEAVLKILQLQVGNPDLLINVIFKPELLGFDVFLCEVEISPILKVFFEKFQAPFDFLENYIAQNLVGDFDVKSNVALKHRNLLKGIRMLESFKLKQLNLQRFSSGLVEALLNKFLMEAENGIIYIDNLQETTLNYCHMILNFALNNTNEFQKFMQCLYKPFKVQTSNSKSKILFGSFILKQFEEAVIEKIFENSQIFLEFALQNESPSQTLEILVQILHCQPNKDFARHLVDKWEFFETNCDLETCLELVTLLVPVVRCDGVTNWLISLLTFSSDSWKYELDIKTQALYLLVNVIENDAPLNELKELQARFFDLAAPAEAIKMFTEKLICTIPKIRSTNILTFILSCYARLNLESDLNLNKLSPQIQKCALREIYKMYSSLELDNPQKYHLILKTIHLFQLCRASEFESFFIDHISEMILHFKQATSLDNVIKKISQFCLVEILFLRTPICSNEEVSPIARAFSEQATNKTILLTLFKYTLDSFKDSVETNELFRLYKCHSYNAMISIVTNSLKEQSFYTKLFIRNENNADILWHSIVDTSRNYIFSTDFESIPKKRKILVNIRDELRAQKRSENVRYLESMRVFNSSLCEDFTKFDFTSSIVRTQNEQNEEGEKKILPTEIELDCVDVNNHECMANVCGLVEFMVTSRITELPEEDEEEMYELPPWIKGIINLLLSVETHKNVKIFWVKVIDNQIHIFKHFARWLLEPLLKFIVDKSAGDSINYFVTDVVAILAKWSTEVVPRTDTEIKLASDLLVFLIENISNDRQDIFKYHLELIRLLIESWKKITIPYELLYSKISTDPMSKKVEIGIHLSSIFLANSIWPWPDKTIDFCKTLFGIVMKNSHKSTYKPCSETIGLLLRCNKSSKIMSNVHVLLKKINDRDKYANVLESISLHCPEIADEHIVALLSRLYAIEKHLKVTYLKIILSRVDILDQFPDFKSENWHNYIENDNLEVQLLTLEIILKCLEVLKPTPNFPLIVKALRGLVNHSNVLCRSKMFDILIELDECQTILQGLTDPDPEIREKVYEFWKRKLPEPIATRFGYCLKNLYETSTEHEFLGYSSFLLLDIIKESEQYKDVLFEHPLDDCDFEHYQLETNWRVRHSSVVPLFAETLRSSSLELAPMEFKLRQTQTNKEFAETQSVRAKEFSQFTQSESSLFVRKDDEFLDPNLVEISQKYKVPKRRFLRDQNKIHKHFAQQEMYKKIQKNVRRRDMAKEKEHNVTIYRSYRKGDLPDVQISLSDVIDPLQAITLHDNEISRILFSEIFQNILKKMKSDADFIKEISLSVENIFKNSIHFNRNLFRTLFDVLFHCRKFLTFPSELVLSLAQNSGLRALGILLLEEYVIAYDHSATNAKKASSSQTGEADLWIKLAQLYRDIDEWDVVKSIFLEKIESPEPERVKEALVAESGKQWHLAQSMYRNLIETDLNPQAKDFYYESYFKCFGHLGEWGKLTESIESLVHSENSWEKLWEDDFNREKLMPWYINAQLKHSLFTENAPTQFFQNLNSSLNSKHCDYLEKNFSEEIAMLWIFNNEPSEAEKYIKAYLSNFLNNWQDLDLFYSSLRYNTLLKLRNIVDINKFLNSLSDLDAESGKKLEDLISYWKRTSNENLPSIILSEERVLYRKQFLNNFRRKISFMNADELDDVLLKLDTVKFNLDESLMEIGIQQNNFFLSRKYLDKYNKQNITKLKVIVSKLAYIKSTNLTEQVAKLQVLIKGCETLKTLLETPDDDIKLEASLELFRQLNEISTIDANIIASKKAELEQLVGDFSERSLSDLGAQQLAQHLANCDSKLLDKIADAYVQLAYFAKKKGRQCFKDFMLYVLKAIACNSREGRQLFPCIVIVGEFSDEETEIFIEETAKIPVWMFLGWIPQILVNIDSPKVTAIAPLVRKMAQIYPQAVMYSYRLSKENYKTINDEAKLLIQELDEILLNDEKVDQFLQALTFVGVPAAILLYHVEKIMKFCQRNSMQEVHKVLNYLQSEFFNSKPESRDVTSMQGNMFKKVAKFKNALNIKSRSNILEACSKVREELRQILNDSRESKKNSKILKDYCPWLANFSANKLNFDLEIPGQYDGSKMPLTQHHVKISTFCVNVSVMSSLRKPIKITILGNDTKEYPFLIKFGEDIRQDQRIQQLFTLMNNLFETDKTLCGRNFSILTYQVIPLTTNLGMIQWIDNTSSLQEFVTSSLKDQKSIRSYEALFDSYNKWVKSGNQPPADAYGRAAMNYTKEKVIVKFKSMVSSLEWDVFRTQFQSLSPTTEIFFSLRNNFISSYAVMCTSHWLLGVGDRHLSNTLISLNSGTVLGIDFGHAFGTATQILPVPELVPFRLTPHIVNLMEPLGEKGLFREVMVHCLRSLRANSGSLLATMNVFIQEPSLDWLEHATRGGAEGTWYPQQKVEQAYRKLRGASSVQVMVEDLKAGQKNGQYLKAYVKLVEGEEGDVRAQKGAEGLSVEDQVDCLIDHATDFNLLGRMYVGWAPWV